MKLFWAGLGLGLAAAVILPKVATRRSGQNGRSTARRSREPSSRSSQPARTAEPPSTLAAIRRQQPTSFEKAVGAGEAQAGAAGAPESAPKAQARNAEEVLNSATRQQLLSVYGIGPVLADRIINNRPYTAAYDVVEKGIIPESTFVQLRKQLLEQQSA